MMDCNEIKAVIEAGLPDATVEVVGDGTHFQALIVSPAFGDKSRLNRERLVQALLKPQFDSGELHALSMSNLTPDEWAARKS